jgi:hypothetical protein
MTRAEEDDFNNFVKCMRRVRHISIKELTPLMQKHGIEHDEWSILFVPLTQHSADRVHPDLLDSNALILTRLPRSEPIRQNQTAGKIFAYCGQSAVVVVGVEVSSLDGDPRADASNASRLVAGRTHFKIGIATDLYARKQLYEKDGWSMLKLFILFYHISAARVEDIEAHLVSLFGADARCVNAPDSGGEHPPMGGKRSFAPAILCVYCCR